MAAFLVTFLTVLCFNLGSTKHVSISEDCYIPDRAQLEGKLDELIRRLPNDYMTTETEMQIIRGSIFLGEGTLYGLDLLQQDRPYKTFCRGEDTVTVFSVFVGYGFGLIVPWTLSSGLNGTIVFKAGFVRFEGELVATKTGACTKYRINYVIPVVLEEMELGMSGGGEMLSKIAEALGFIMPGLLKKMWVRGIAGFVGMAFQQVLEELN